VFTFAALFDMWPRRKPTLADDAAFLAELHRRGIRVQRWNPKR
jgi:hypothetical protein